MMSAGKNHPTHAGAYFAIRVCAQIAAALAVIVAWAILAQAADPVFPIGSRIGLVPPPGMIASQTFNGFVDPDKDAAILFVTFPPVAYDQLDKSMAPAELKKQGIEIDNREPIDLGFAKGFLIKSEQSSAKGRFRKWLLVAAASDLTLLVTVQVPDEDTSYPDKAIRDALATLALRANVPDAERLSLLPFKVADFAGFHIDDVLPGSALMLVDGPPPQAKDQAKDQGKNQGKDALPPGAQSAHLIIAAMQGGPADDGDRDKFAQSTFDQIGGIKDVQIQDTEPLRIDGQPGYETLAKAKDGTTGVDIMVIQWLRFGSGGYLQMIGVARTDDWPNVFTRLRAVRDAVDPK
jgi:hypothetical protein